MNNRLVYPFTAIVGQDAMKKSLVLNAINLRPWVSGFVSRGYFTPVALQDKSASIHGKPTSDILWYWFPRLLGNIK